MSEPIRPVRVGYCNAYGHPKGPHDCSAFTGLQRPAIDVLHQFAEAMGDRDRFKALTKRLYEALSDDHDGWDSEDPFCGICSLLDEAKHALQSAEPRAGA